MHARDATLLAVMLCAAPASGAPEDSLPEFPFEEGDVVTFDRVEALRPWLPKEFWDHRDFFLFEGMQLAIGPSHRDYAPADVYREATARHAGRASLGPDGSLVGYVAGQPFPDETIRCAEDPQAGTKIAWNLDYRWDGDGARARYLYTYWDRGERLPLYFEGTSKIIQLAHRPEPQYAPSGDVIRGDPRKSVWGIEVDAPFDVRGLRILTYRYLSSDGPRADAANDDTWVYVPSLRRVRRVSSAQRTDAVSGTDFTLDDLQSFSGIVPQYAWECLGELEVLAPMNSVASGYPYGRDHDFGPYGLSYANDRWELRRAWKIRFTPRDAAHPYHHKDILLDREAYTPLYAFAYDRKGELWKILWHDHRWSGETLEADEGSWYEGWEGVEVPRDLRVVSDVVVNVQTGTGNRIEFWDSHGMPLESRGRMRRYIDVGRLLDSH